MRKYYITDHGLAQVEIVPTSRSLDDQILSTLADFKSGMTITELADYLNYEIESFAARAEFLLALSRLMNKEFVTYED